MPVNGTRLHRQPPPYGGIATPHPREGNRERCSAHAWASDAGVAVNGTLGGARSPGCAGGRTSTRPWHTCPHAVRHRFAAYGLGKDKLYGHIKKTKNRSKFLEFCLYLRTLYPPTVRLAIVCDPARTYVSPPPPSPAHDRRRSRVPSPRRRASGRGRPRLSRQTAGRREHPSPRRRR